MRTSSTFWAIQTSQASCMDAWSKGDLVLARAVTKHCMLGHSSIPAALRLLLSEFSVRSSRSCSPFPPVIPGALLGALGGPEPGRSNRGDHKRGGWGLLCSGEHKAAPPPGRDAGRPSAVAA
jgi:hypothetical protein